MFYKVVRNCYGFLGRHWTAGAVINPSDFGKKWPKDVKKIPRHILPLDEAGHVVEPEINDRIAMSDMARKMPMRPETVNNTGKQDQEEEAEDVMGNSVPDEADGSPTVVKVKRAYNKRT